MKVLIVEDDREVARTTARILRSESFDVVIAADALAATSAARQHPPDVVLLDLGLPAGGGTVVVERLQAMPATSLVPVIVVTGGAHLHEVTRLEDLGVYAVLTKPVPPEDLVRTIKESLGDD